MKFSFPTNEDRENFYHSIHSLWHNTVQTKPRSDSLNLKKREISIEKPDKRGRDLPTKEDWTLILKGAKLCNYEANEVIIHEKQNLQRIHQIVSGSCRLEINKNGKKEILLATMKENEIFGELSFLEETETSVSVIAKEKTSVFVIDGVSIRVLSELKPGLGGRFYKYLATIIESRLINRIESYKDKNPFFEFE